MRRLLSVSLVLIAAAGALPAVGHSKDSMSKTKSITVSGSLIDTKCYSMDSRNMGNDHITPMGEMKGCGTLCAKLGIPVEHVGPACDGYLDMLRRHPAVAALIGAEARSPG